MFVMVGDEVSVENLLKGIIVASGNDACIALAEGIAGTEEEFALMMTSKTKKSEWKIQTLQILLELMIQIITDCKRYYDYVKLLNKKTSSIFEWFSEKEFTWDRTGGDPITQGNRNPLLYKNMGADGIKTGYLAVERVI